MNSPIYTDHASKFIGWPILASFIAQVNRDGKIFIDLLYFEPDPPRRDTVAIWRIKRGAHGK